MPDIGWTGMTGRANDKMVRMIVPYYIERTFYSSGTVAMVDAMAALLKGLKVPEDKINSEIFPGYD